MTPFVFKGSHDSHPAHGITHHALIKGGCIGTAAVETSLYHDQSQHGNVDGGQKHTFRNDYFRRTIWNPEIILHLIPMIVIYRGCRTWRSLCPSLPFKLVF